VLRDAAAATRPGREGFGPKPCGSAHRPSDAAWGPERVCHGVFSKCGLRRGTLADFWETIRRTRPHAPRSGAQRANRERGPAPAQENARGSSATTPGSQQAAYEGRTRHGGMQAIYAPLISLIIGDGPRRRPLHRLSCCNGAAAWVGLVKSQSAAGASNDEGDNCVARRTRRAADTDSRPVEMAAWATLRVAMSTTCTITSRYHRRGWRPAEKQSIQMGRGPRGDRRGMRECRHAICEGRAGVVEDRTVLLSSKSRGGQVITRRRPKVTP